MFQPQVTVCKEAIDVCAILDKDEAKTDGIGIQDSQEKEEVLKKVLENTKEKFNEISDVKNKKPNDGVKGSKFVRMKLSLKLARQENKTKSTIEGADIFFAKQFSQY